MTPHQPSSTQRYDRRVITTPIDPPPHPDFDAIAIDLCRLADITEHPLQCTAALDDDEITEADAFHQDLHRAWFIKRRWLRKCAIAECCDINIESIRIEHNELGRPLITAPSNAARLTLSTSHSMGLAAVALAPGLEFGIDIEFLEPEYATPAAARVFMHPDELDTWRTLRDTDRVAAFFDTWTRKEALLKAHGTGFKIDPPLVNVSATHVDLEGVTYHIQSISELPDGWVGAVAVQT